MNLAERYYLQQAAAYVRGELPLAGEQYPGALSSLDHKALAGLLQIGKENGLKIYRFKKSRPLPRINKTIGILRGVHPSSLLDIGTGRGVFLIPFLDIFPNLPITCIDLLEHRVRALHALKRGGMQNINPLMMDVTKLNFKAQQFDAVTALEVLEHIADLAQAVSEICRVAKQHVLFSVPSKEDDNPEHIHLLTPEQLQPLFSQNGFGKIKVSHVHNHLIGLVARV